MICAIQDFYQILQKNRIKSREQTGWAEYATSNFNAADGHVLSQVLNGRVLTLVLNERSFQTPPVNVIWNRVFGKWLSEN